ncbi:unnamed protein product [Allacma fusca]|uniref:Uncharacterized protein n=1 Tax=Allacma fusca TaxID=39272 RepID=A0A8J2KNN7_9HEXA|nr:unnamed protein product [Allacma fusca]
MEHKYIVSGIFTNFLFGAISYVINIFAQKYKDEETLLYGIAGLFAASSVVLYAFIWKWNNVRTWSFYLVYVPLFLTSTFDFITTVDVWRESNGVFLKEYLEIKDYHVHQVVGTNNSIFDGTIIHVLNFISLWRLGSGKSTRSLQLISATGLSMMCSVYAFCVLTSELPLHLLTKIFLTILAIYVFLLPFGVLMIPRSFVLSHKQGSGSAPKLLRLITLPLLVAAGAVIVAKALVLNGVKNEYLEIVRLNDPLIFLNDVEKTFPLIAGVIWQNVIVSLPLLLISFIYHFKTSKPTILWELSIINLGTALLNQFLFIGGSLFWKTPEDLQVNPANVTFWIINLIPVVGTLAQVVSLVPFRASLVSVKAKSKKRS